MTAVLSPHYSPQAEAALLYGGPDTPPAADPGVAYLTPDALMAYCHDRLSAIDSQIGTVMASQKSTIADVNDINSALATLQRYAGGATSKDDCQSMETALRTSIDNIASRDPNSSVLPALKQAYNDLVYTGTGTQNNLYYAGYPAHAVGDFGDGQINSQEMTGFISTLNNASAELNSGAELQLVNIQSLMSQRDTTVQLTTNLVQSL
ncbi:MAG TPA: hypothetical protein VKU41_30190, partial [Polyangiaceae bacterium]|nr:hypothetical protein [Polyangiaceae bacterium]